MSFYFDPVRLNALALEHRASFAAANPFPHAVLDHILPSDVADDLLDHFPKEDHPCWLHNEQTHLFQPSKLELANPGHLYDLPARVHDILLAFNSASFLDFLEQLTGIPHLIPDPYYVGGGVHQVMRGGSLAVHTDFNFHQRLQLYRRLNLLVYLNKDWEDAYYGHLELWDKQMEQCQKRVSPDFNRLVIFNISHANHGHPTPLACPPDMSRKSLALYYYTAEPDPENRKTSLSAIWQNPVWLGDFLEKTLLTKLLARSANTHSTGCVRFRAVGSREENWLVNMGENTVTVQGSGDAQCQVAIDTDTFSDLMTNRMDWQRAFAKGLVVLSGDQSLFMELFALFDT